MGDEIVSHTAKLEVPFATSRLAEIAYEVIRVDSEPKRSGVKKELSLQENILHAKFSAEQPRQLRVAVNAFFDNIILIMQTVDSVGPPVSESYSHYN